MCTFLLTLPAALRLYNNKIPSIMNIFMLSTTAGSEFVYRLDSARAQAPSRKMLQA